MPPIVQETNSEISRQQLLLRLTALWALAEAVLGGVLHAFRIPFTGLVVGGSALVLLCLLGWHRQGRGQLLKATLLVCMVKALLSPQAPPAAYLAVLFQGVLAELLLTSRRGYRWRCVMLCVLALAESALQKVLLLTLLAGSGWWQALDALAQSIISNRAPVQLSLWLVGAYVSVHVLAGLAIGWWASGLPARLALAAKKTLPMLPAVPTPVVLAARKKRANRLVQLLWLLPALLLVFSYTTLATQLLPRHQIVYLLVRTVLGLTLWTMVVAPLLLQALHKWLAGHEGNYSTELKALLELLPGLKQLAVSCWRAAATKTRLARVHLFVLLLLAAVLNPKAEAAE